MTPEDLFEAVKGNVGSIDLNDLIRRAEDDFASWLEPYYSWSERERVKQMAAMYSRNPRAYMYFEPEWPAGQKRVLSRRYKEHQARIQELVGLRYKLLRLVFDTVEDDYEHDFEVDPITVRRTLKEEKE